MNLQHLFLAAVWSGVTRFPASGTFKCHYLPRLSFDLVVRWIPLHYGILSSLFFLEFSVGVRAFVMGLSQISPFFSCHRCCSYMCMKNYLKKYTSLLNIIFQ